MAINFQNVADKVTDQGVKILVPGDPGVGKTVLASTTGEPTLLIDAEAGTMSIRNAKHIKVFSVTSDEPLTQIFPVLEYLRTNNDQGFRWVIIDSISELAEMVLTKEKANFKNGMKAYGEMADKMIPFCKAFRDLEGMNVVMTAKLKDEKDPESGTIEHRASAPGKQLSAQLPYLFDLVLPLRIIKNPDGETERWLMCEGDQGWVAKDRSGKLDKWEEPNLAAIRDKVVGKPINSKPAVVKAA